MEYIEENRTEILIKRTNPEFIEKLSRDLPNIFSASSGATCVVGPINYLESFRGININPRKGGHVFKTVIHQKINENTFLIGLVYFDNYRKVHREDMFSLHIDLMYIRKYTKTEFEKEYPNFKGFHTSYKDFLVI